MDSGAPENSDNPLQARLHLDAVPEHIVNTKQDADDSASASLECYSFQQEDRSDDEDEEVEYHDSGTFYHYLVHAERELGFPLRGLLTSDHANPITSARSEVPNAISEYERARIIDFMTAVQGKAHLTDVTLHLGIQLADRALAVWTSEHRSPPGLLLLYVTCLFIARKYDERRGQRLCDFLYIAGNKLRVDAVVACERDVLKTLDWKLYCPTAVVYVRRFCEHACASEKQQCLCSLVCEMALRSLYLASALPSHLAAAALMVANRTLGMPPWPETLVAYTSLTEEEIAPLAHEMSLFTRDIMRSFHINVRRKYSDEQHYGVWSLLHR